MAQLYRKPVGEKNSFFRKCMENVYHEKNSWISSFLSYHINLSFNTLFTNFLKFTFHRNRKGLAKEIIRYKDAGSNIYTTEASNFKTFETNLGFKLWAYHGDYQTGFSYVSC